MKHPSTFGKQLQMTILLPAPPAAKLKQLLLLESGRLRRSTYEAFECYLYLSFKRLYAFKSN